MPVTSAPTLLTARMELRGHRESDLDDSVRLWSDPTVTRYTTGSPLTRQDVWALLGFGYWLAFERQSGAFLGEVGIARFKRNLMQGHPELERVPEAGWVFLPAVHGQGYASEAVDAVLNWRDEHVPGTQTFCIISPENAPSLNLAAKFGFVVTDEVSDEQGSVLVLRRG